MLVRNLQEDSHSPTCGCGTWIHHWEKGSGRKRGHCCAKGCFKEADRGGHVQRKDIKDNSWYIIPICVEHNNQFGQEFEIEDSTTLVPVGKSKECGS
jgi:hypothetical protein